MQIVIMSSVIMPRDAIGHDVIKLYEMLAGTHQTAVYGERVQSHGLRQLDRGQVTALLADASNLAIYHHSTHWPAGEELLEAASARLIIRFHNITPPAFFQFHSPEYTESCREGCRQTIRLIQKHPEALWMADSTFNMQEGGLEGLSHVEVVPPFNNASAWHSMAPDSTVLKALQNNHSLNLLFVGRMVPNKGHRFLLEVIHDFRRHYGTPVILHMLGRRDPRLVSYSCEVDQMAAAYGLQNSIHWIESLSEPELLSYYKGCDFYLSCSEHEGFCVPLVEAQCLRLPVLARRCGAVEETLDRRQLVLGDDPADYSAALHVLTCNRAHRKQLVKAGADNYARRFTATAIAQRFRAAVSTHLGEQL